MSSIGRNDPCPCGSGKKYKKCCVGKYDTVVGAQSGKAADAAQADGDSEYEPYPYEDRGTNAWEEYDVDAQRWTVPDRNEAGDLPIYPDPPQHALPALPHEQVRLVDDWWKAEKPLFRKRDADAMLLHLTQFWDQHPELVPYLEIETEFLLELGAELGDRKEWPRYTDVLWRLRVEHPVAYVRSFGYFEYDLIIESLVQGRFADIPRYFDFFQRYPGSDGYNGDRIARLLAWAGAEEALLEFVKPLRKTPDDRGVSLDADWLLFALQIPYLSAGTDPDEAANRVEQELSILNLAHAPRPAPAYLRNAFDRARQSPSLPDYERCRTWVDVDAFLHDVTWNFAGFLHSSKGFPWTRAFFLADRLRHYWDRRAEDGRPKTPFSLDVRKLEVFLCRTCRDFFNCDGVLTASGIEAMGHFADYLRACGTLGEQQRLDLREGCCTLYLRAMTTYDSTDPVPRLIPALLLGN